MLSKNTEETTSYTSDRDNLLFFGEWLKARRKQLDLTQNELADLACCSVFTLRKIETGERRPSKQLAGMLAVALGVSPADHSSFIKVARGEVGVDKLQAPSNEPTPNSKAGSSPGNLPRALTPFIGREAELTALGQLLRDPQCSLLTIVGAGGIGKTRLAIEAGKQSREFFPEGAWFIPLAKLTSPAHIVPTIAECVGYKFQDPTNLQVQLVRYLQAKNTLLVLDNAEHLLEGAGVFTDIILACPKIKLLVTSRERLNLLSEWIFELQGLPVPPNTDIEQFDTNSSVALFAQSARRVNSSFEIRDEERLWVLKICQVMEGMPLGIELSAAWVGMLPVREIAEEIEKDLDFLTTTLRDIPERQRSMRATLDHTWKLLNPEEKLILSRLSVFPGRFSRKDAQEVCEASLPVLSLLRSKSLLQRLEEDDYALHEIIRQYAVSKVAEYAGEPERTKDRHAQHFVKYLADCEHRLQSSSQVDAIDEMALVIENLSLAWQHMVKYCLVIPAEGNPFPAGMLHSALFSLNFFYEARCRSLEAICLFKESVEDLKAVRFQFEESCAAAQFRSLVGHITAYLVLHYYRVLQNKLAMDCYEEALLWLQDDQSRVIKAQAQVMLASSMDRSGTLQEATDLLANSRDIFKEAGERWWYSLATINLAWCDLSSGNLLESESLFREAFQLVTPGDMRLELLLRNGYATLLFIKNDFAQAEQILRETLQLSYRLGNIRQSSLILLYLGRIALATQKDDLAEEYLQKSIRGYQELGESNDLAIACIHLGKCYAAQRQGNAARAQFKRAIGIGQVLSQFDLVYYGLVNIAFTYLDDGRTDQALDIYCLLRHCPMEYVRLQADFDHLGTLLYSALPEGQFDIAIKQMDNGILIDEAKDAVLAYVKEHEAI